MHNLISVQPPRSTRSSSLVTLDRPPTSSSLRNRPTYNWSLLSVCLIFSLESTSYSLRQPLRGNVRTSSIARWKDRERLPIRHNWTFFARSYRCGAKAKRVKTRCYQERVGHLEPRFQEEGVVPGEYFFGFYKNRHILLSDIVQTAPCYTCVVLTQYRRRRRVTDGRTDRQNCRS